MKNLIILITGLLFFTSCEKDGEILVQNKLSNVVIYDVRWGSIYVASELLPGETSSGRTVTNSEVDLPAASTVSFEMSANKKSIFLQTIQSYRLDEDGKITIVIDDNTEVTNPNQ